MQNSTLTPFQLFDKAITICIKAHGWGGSIEIGLSQNWPSGSTAAQQWAIRQAMAFCHRGLIPNLDHLHTLGRKRVAQLENKTPKQAEAIWTDWYNSVQDDPIAIEYRQRYEASCQEGQDTDWE